MVILAEIGHNMLGRYCNFSNDRGQSACGLGGLPTMSGLSIIEQLLVEHDWVLNLPGFLAESGCAHTQVAHKLCCQMVRVLKDIGVDTPSLGLIEEDPVDYDGVDLLATTLLGGL
ncbi:hypothetical protein B0H14DRAFT_2638109 [Mycena olivaceomarginata]|nr:hypothetical protein B0H14DRAFT_2638109 [Mycena olivaceomarginata]